MNNVHGQPSIDLTVTFAVRTHLAALVNFSGTHREHTDKLEISLEYFSLTPVV